MYSSTGTVATDGDREIAVRASARAEGNVDVDVARMHDEIYGAVDV